LHGLTPHEFICQQWLKQPEPCIHDPFYLTLRLYI
jgi:hypothetical protein